MNDEAWAEETNKKLTRFANTLGTGRLERNVIQSILDFIGTAKIIKKEEEALRAAGQSVPEACSTWQAESNRRLSLTRRYFRPSEIKHIQTFLDREGK